MDLQSLTVATPDTAMTMPQLIRAAAATYGDEVAITLKGETIPDESISFDELGRQTAALAKGLIEHRVGKGARVGFISGNGPSFAIFLGAIARIGAVAVPISTMIKADEFVRVLRQSDVIGILVQRKFLGADFVQRLCDALPELREGDEKELRILKAPFLRWVVSAGDGLPDSFMDLPTLVGIGERTSDDHLAEIEAEVHPTDQMVEIYTSGSMALPKGVKHTHGAVLARTRYLVQMLGAARGKDVNAFLPMFWVGGMMMYLLPDWMAGAKTTCTEKTLSSSQVAMGVVLAPDDLKMMGQKPYWGLGMSETLGPYSYGNELRAPGHQVCAPMDHFAEGFEVRVADEFDAPVGDNVVGEIQVRGPAVTPALHKIDRAEYFTPDGFYHTGDMGMREGTRLHFMGRNGDIIKTAGSNVSPTEVEMELLQFEGIHSAYVVGVPDAERGQLVAAAIVPREGALLDFDDIQRKLRNRLSSYKVPRRYVAIAREEVPMLASNKVSRRHLQDVMAVKLGHLP